MNRDSIKRTDAGVSGAAIIGFLLVVPFAVLELSFQTITRRNAPGLILLFGLLWILPTAFIVTLMPIVRTIRAGSGITAHPLRLMIRVALLALISMAWGGLVIDQLPCFLGIPNCD